MLDWFDTDSPFILVHFEHHLKLCTRSLDFTKFHIYIVLVVFMSRWLVGWLVWRRWSIYSTVQRTSSIRSTCKEHSLCIDVNELYYIYERSQLNSVNHCERGILLYCHTAYVVFSILIIYILFNKTITLTYDNFERASMCFL